MEHEEECVGHEPRIQGHDKKIRRSGISIREEEGMGHGVEEREDRERRRMKE